MNKKISFFLLGMYGLMAKAQVPVTFPVNGAHDPLHTTYAFTNCTLHVDYETIINNARLLIRDGQILDAGENIKIPAEAIVSDLNGRHIYPAFIDLYSDYGMPEQKAPVPGQRNERGHAAESNIKGAFGWNQAIKADAEACKLFINNEKLAEELRKTGFATVLTVVKDGIMRGSGALVTLGQTSEQENIIRDRAAAFYSFSKGSSTQDYPSSLMGSIALIRQTFYDAQWYQSEKGRKEFNLTLESVNKLQSLPQIFEAKNKLNVLRAAKLGKEFNINFIIKGAGDEYQRLQEIQQSFCKLIIPLNFPEAYDVEDPMDADMISLSDLKHWELAPANAKFLQDAGIQFAFTAADLKDKKLFLKNLQKAIQYGLTEANALKALTATPAQYIGMADKLGSLKKGMMASFIICSKNIADESCVIQENWVEGKQFILAGSTDIRGKYTLNIGNNSYKVELNGEADKPGGQVLKDTLKFPLTISLKNLAVSFSFMTDSVHGFRCSGMMDTKNFSSVGKCQTIEGEWMDYRLSRTEPYKEEKKKKEATDKPKELHLGEIIYPFCSYGLPETKESLLQKFKNRSAALLIKDATVWTNENEGVLKEQDVYVVDGKIVRIADNIEVPKGINARIIDAKGKHLTPGIIDEHSHIAISEGVNEGTQASSAEVRIGDVVNPDDINIYRQLAGGVTCSQLLHGSANPIGGQSCLIKLRWGLGAEDMKYDKADGFIKFALGENVKQANWGDAQVTRFPQTRMGVEQVYFDHFIRAREYAEKQKLWKEAKDKGAFRRDLELEALSEILLHKRFITCHSYVQSEINMLMHVADSMGFKVNTFTHILEGYKVADKMKKHGVSASTFADWWAYKMEVMDAIPYNAALLTKMGVNTSINSDDAEMGRRLNQEAAKSLKYGGLTEEEALKLCTLNPAKMLHVDDKVGSIKAGKVADLVLWSDNPLSIYARAEKTIIDGIIYYDAENDQKQKEYLQKERARIIAKMLAEKSKGGKVNKPSVKKGNLYHCDTMESEYLWDNQEHLLDLQNK